MMDDNKQYLKNESGAASVLVVVMMLVLVVFGLAMITTSLAQFRLSQNHEKFIDDHYDLESMVQDKIYNIDQILYEAEVSTVTYFSNMEIADETYEGLVMNHFDYNDEFIYTYETDDEKTEYINEIFTGVYEEVFTDSLYALADSDETISVEYIETDELSGMTVVRISIASEGATYQKYLNVTLELMMPEYTLDYKAEKINAVKSFETNRYTMTKYQQEQIAFDYDEGIKFQNPFEKPE